MKTLIALMMLTAFAVTGAQADPLSTPLTFAIKIKKDGVTSETFP